MQQKSGRIQLAQRYLRAGIVLLAVSLPFAAHGSADPQARVPLGKWRKVTLIEYRQHLMHAMQLVEECSGKRDLATCDPLKVGLDDLVPVSVNGSSEWRLVRFGWLRVLLFRAEDPDAPASGKASAGGSAASTTEPRDEPNTTELLHAAKVRLAHDLAQATALMTQPTAYPTERAMMLQVLAGRDFRDLKQPSDSQYLKERLNAWLNRLFEQVAQWRAGSAWIGRVVVVVFLLAVCAGLAWGLVQVERRWRARLKPEMVRSAAKASAPLEWERWLEEARSASAAGAWRQAIHAAYWAAITRLESHELWPVDRARTPREYLALVATGDPRREDLAQLTRTFERTWYGGRSAEAAEFQKAEELSAVLIATEAGQFQPGGGMR